MIKALVGRRATIGLAVVCVALFGLWSYMDLPREAAPDVEIPKVVVTTPYPGVAPADMESLVTIPMESELSNIRGLEKMTSVSSEGFSIVSLEFEPEVVIEDALQRVRDRVATARSDLPDDVEETDIREVRFSDFPIMLVTIGGPIEEEHLKGLGEELEEAIERIPGVFEADLSGGRTREIHVYVDPNRLNHYGLSLQDVNDAIGAENVNVPGGDVTSGDTTFLLRVPGEFNDPQEIEGVAIKRVGDRPVFVRDVARIVDGYAERASYARMNGEVAVSIGVKKRAGGNILAIADRVRELSAEHASDWPEGVQFRILADESRQVRDMVADLENGIITSLLLVSMVLLFFMGVRNSLFVALAIPLSMLASFMFVHLFGMTLNMVVLFALIMAMGMLVDNAIVVVENIFRHIEMGEDRRTAAIEGTREVAMAVAASTATTVAAFAPLIFWTGLMGEFMGHMPRTIVIVLVCSLVVAVAVLPAFTAGFMKPTPAKKRKGEIGRLMRQYQRILGWSIRHRYWSLLIGLGVFVGTFVAYGQLSHGTEFFPETEPNRATVNVRAPDGTDLETTDRIVRRVESLIAEEENVDVFVAETGVGGASNPMAASEAAPNWGRITIDFLPDRNTAEPGETIRVEPTTRTIDRLRRLAADIPGADISVDKEMMGPPVGAPIEVQVRGENVHEVGRIASRVRREMRQIPGAIDLADDYRVGRPEMRLSIDRGAATRVGASTRKVANTVRMAVAGYEASKFRDGDDEYDIRVSLAPEYREDLEAILSLRIPGREDTSPDTFPVPISSVASYELAGGSGNIRHVDQDLVVRITGDIAEGYNANAVRADVQDYIDQAELPGGFTLAMGGANDDQQETQEFLSRAFAIALALILFVLVAQFNRFSIPFIILASVAMSLVGVLWGLIIREEPFGIMMTGLGVISLAGIVVNNAIVLLEYVEQLRARGLSMFEALIEAGTARFRPVLLTAITTILGLIPMATGIGIDFFRGRILLGSTTAVWWGPMATAIVFGLAAATIMTLVMVPTMYGVAEDVRRGFRRLVPAPRRGPRGSSPPDERADEVGEGEAATEERGSAPSPAE